MDWIRISVLSLTIASFPVVTGQSFRLVEEVPLTLDARHRVNHFVWTGDALSSVPDHSAKQTIRLMNRRGEEQPSIQFTLPGMTEMWMENVARSLDGRTAVVGTAFDASKKGGGFLTLISAEGQWSTIRLHRYSPRWVRFMPDGTIWTLGYEEENPNGKVIENGGLFRQFDSTGKQIASHVPMNTVSKPLAPSLGDLTTNGILATAKGRVGWYADLAGRYFELSSAGALTEYEGLPNNLKGVASLALTDSGATIVGTGVPPDNYVQLWSLDRQKKTWAPLDAPWAGPDTSPLLFGASGNVIAVSIKWGRLSFYEVQ